MVDPESKPLMETGLIGALNPTIGKGFFEKYGPVALATFWLTVTALMMFGVISEDVQGTTGFVQGYGIFSGLAGVYLRANYPTK